MNGRSLVGGGLVLFVLAGLAIPLGAAWTAKRLTNDAASSIWPRLAVSGTSVHVVWESVTPGMRNISFLSSPDGGATWPRFRRLTTGAKAAREPHVAASGSSVYAVWDEFDEPDGTIFFRRSPDGGATWLPAKRIASGDTGFKRSARVAAEGSNVYVVWEATGKGGSHVYFRRSVDGGRTWQAPRPLTIDQGVSNTLALAVSGASVYAAWSYCIDELRQVICFRSSSDRGASWGGVHRFREAGGLSMWPTLAASGASVYLVWSHWNSDESSNTEIYFSASLNRGGGWGPVLRLTNNPRPSQLPGCAAAGSKVFTVYADDRAGNDEIYVRASGDGGAIWGGAYRMTKNAGPSTWPDIACGDQGAYVVWSDGSPGNNEIYVAVTKLPK